MPATFCRHSRPALAALAGATLAALIAAGPAAAGSIEQINRLSGAQGNGFFTHDSQVIAASDSGRFGVFTDFDYGTSVSRTYVRDIQSNTTKSLGDFPNHVIGVDAAEKLALVSWQSAGGDDTIFAVRPTNGGPAKVVYVASAADTAGELSAAISGDGKTVVIALGQVKVIKVATGATKTYDVPLAKLGTRSISDDGSVIAGTTFNSEGFKIVNGVVTLFDRPALVSPNGAAIVRYASSQQYGSPDQVTVEKPNGAGKKTFTLPAGGGYIGWVAPDGSSIVVTGAQTAEQLTFATGKWKPFGGPFAASLDADLTGFNIQPASVISRNGKFAALTYGNNLASQAALVNLSGGDLPGAQEALTASSYMVVSPVISTCGQPAATYVSFQQPESWLPKPKRGDISITVDGASVYKSSSSKPYILDQPSTFQLPATVPIPAGAQSITIAAKVVDQTDNYLRTTETTKPFCIGGFPF